MGTYFLCHIIYCPLYRKEKRIYRKRLAAENQEHEVAANLGEVRAEDVRVCWMGDQPDWLSSPCAIFFVYERSLEGVNVNCVSWPVMGRTAPVHHHKIRNILKLRQATTKYQIEQDLQFFSMGSPIAKFGRTATRSFT